MASESVTELLAPTSDGFSSLGNLAAYSGPLVQTVGVDPISFGMWFNNVWEMECYRRETISYTDPDFAVNNVDESATLLYFRTSFGDGSARWGKDYPPPLAVIGQLPNGEDYVGPSEIVGQQFFSYDPDDAPDGPYLPLPALERMLFHTQGDQLKVLLLFDLFGFDPANVTSQSYSISPTELSISAEARFPFGAYEIIYTSEFRSTVTRQFY